MIRPIDGFIGIDFLYSFRKRKKKASPNECKF